MIENCPCGSQNNFKECCFTIHQKIELAETAEQLMRSRYSAFVKLNIDYLIQSHHSKTRPKSKKEINSLLNWAKAVTFVKLEITKTAKGLLKDEKGKVSFKAYYYENGKINCLQENSLFIKENKHWVYLGIDTN